MLNWPFYADRCRDSRVKQLLACLVPDTEWSALVGVLWPLATATRRRGSAPAGEDRCEVERLADVAGMPCEKTPPRAASLHLQPFDPRARTLERATLAQQIASRRPDPVQTQTVHVGRPIAAGGGSRASL